MMEEAMTYSKQDINDGLKMTENLRERVELSYLNKPDWSRSEVNELIHLIDRYTIDIHKAGLQNAAAIDDVMQKVMKVESALLNEHLGGRPPPEMTMGERMSQLVSVLKAMEKVLRRMG